MAEITETTSKRIKQYKQLQKENPEHVIWFRSGNFYEAYGNSAKVSHTVLGITLTNIEDCTGNIEYTAFPHHGLDVFLPRMIRAGKRVAIFDPIK